MVSEGDKMGITYSFGWYELRNGEIFLKEDREISGDEFIKIGQSSELLSYFNMNNSYYDMMEKNFEEVLKIINQFEQNRESFTYEKDSVPYIKELNRLLINALGSFFCFINHYEYILKTKFEKDTLSKPFKKICSYYFDNYFEYRFLYKLRNYVVHCNIPVSLIQSTQNNPKRSFYINVTELLAEFDWGEKVKKDLENFYSNIEVKSFIINVQNMLYTLNKELMSLDIHGIITSINYLKAFARLNDNKEAQMPVIIINDSNNPEKIEIKSFGDNFFEAIQTVVNFKISY